MFAEATKDPQSITSDWEPLNQRLIEGVSVIEIKNVIKGNGFLTEMFRKDWFEDGFEVEQVFQTTLVPDGISAWHTHLITTDRLFVNAGTIKVVIYDDRTNSPTRGLLNEFRLSILRPQLLVIPPDIWHGIKNMGNEMASIINMVDIAYSYEDPDQYRLPTNSPLIPYTF